MGEFVIRKTYTGFKFDLKASNGGVIATSQVYASLASCKKGCASVAKNALIAEIEDQTIENYEACQHPKFVLYVDRAGRFRFRLKATNGEIIAASEVYSSKAGCLKGIESVQKNVVNAPVLRDE